MCNGTIKLEAVSYLNVDAALVMVPIKGKLRLHIIVANLFVPLKLREMNLFVEFYILHVGRRITQMQ